MRRTRRVQAPSQWPYVPGRQRPTIPAVAPTISWPVDPHTHQGQRKLQEEKKRARPTFVPTRSSALDSEKSTEGRLSSQARQPTQCHPVCQNILCSERATAHSRERQVEGALEPFEPSQVRSDDFRLPPSALTPPQATSKSKIVLSLRQRKPGTCYGSRSATPEREKIEAAVEAATRPASQPDGLSLNMAIDSRPLLASAGAQWRLGDCAVYCPSRRRTRPIHRRTAFSLQVVF